MLEEIARIPHLWHALPSMQTQILTGSFSEDRIIDVQDRRRSRLTFKRVVSECGMQRIYRNRLSLLDALYAQAQFLLPCATAKGLLTYHHCHGARIL